METQAATDMVTNAATLKKIGARGLQRKARDTEVGAAKTVETTTARRQLAKAESATARRKIARATTRIRRDMKGTTSRNPTAIKSEVGAAATTAESATGAIASVAVETGMKVIEGTHGKKKDSGAANPTLGRRASITTKKTTGIEIVRTASAETSENLSISTIDILFDTSHRCAIGENAIKTF